MKHCIPGSLLILLLSITFNARAQSSAATLDVVCWNLEFFGAPYNSGPADKDLQEVNTKKIMRFLNADLYGLLEIVDTMRLRRLVDSLGNTEFGYVVAPYCSNNTTGTGAGWTSGQKQAYIYRKSVFSNVTTRGIMRNSAAAYTNWASGRFPFLLTATATINGTSKNLHFILLHGKSGSTADDYTKRQAAAFELKDTLDTFFSTANTFIIGDFNDALHNSIYPGAAASSYSSIVNDSTDADHYRSVTLPLGAAGQTSMINFPNVIDNQIISNEAEAYYIRNSAKVRTDVTTVVPDYITGHTVSDHFPVFTNYSLDGLITGIPVVSAPELGLRVSPNPFTGTLRLLASKTLLNVQLTLLGSNGQIIQQQSLGIVPAGTNLATEWNVPAKGIYFLQVSTPQMRSTYKLVRY